MWGVHPHCSGFITTLLLRSLCGYAGLLVSASSDSVREWVYRIKGFFNPSKKFRRVIAADETAVRLMVIVHFIISLRVCRVDV